MSEKRFQRGTRARVYAQKNFHFLVGNYEGGIGPGLIRNQFRAKINCGLASLLASKHRIKDNPRRSLVSFSLSPTLFGVVSQELELLIHHFENVVFRRYIDFVES